LEKLYLQSRLLAAEHCNSGSNACRWYHGNWHLLKALGIVTSSAVHERELSGMLRRAIASTPQPRLLLSGSTDETLLRLAHETCRDLGIRPRIVALDRCATPLVFMEHYAREHVLDLTTVCSNILDFASDEQFDIILTHAFLGYFDAQQRPRLIEKWNTLLAEGGQIITIQRVRPPESPPTVQFSTEQSAHFVEAALAAAEQQGVSEPEDTAAVEQAATVFAANFRAYSINSKAEIRKLFVDAGLELAMLEYRALASRGMISGPSVPARENYAHIVAIKRRP